MEKFDVVIAGASFAGLALAKLLPQNLKILVVDSKAEIGRTVESTGLITENTRREFAEFFDIGKFITNPIDSFCVVAPDFGKYFFSRTREPWIYQTDTRALVKALASSIPANVELRTGTLFSGSKNDGETKTITLLHGGEKYEVTAHFLIGADGGVSAVAASEKLERNSKFLYGYEQVHFGRVLLGENPETTIYHFWFGEFSLGYGGWLSPTAIDGRPAIRLGLAKLMRDRADAKALTDRFVAKLIESKIIALDGAPLSPNHVFGGLIPIGGALKRISGNGSLLIGNAAGHCGAFAADGIKGAIVAAKEAAPLIARYLRGEKDATRKLPQMMNRHDWIMDYYRRQVRYRKVWDMMKRDRTFTALWETIAREKESFLNQFCDSKDKRHSLAWTILKPHNFGRLFRFACFLLLDIFFGRTDHPAR